MTTPQARERLANEAEALEDCAKRFRIYHAESVAREESSEWDRRAEQEASLAASIRWALNRLNVLETALGRIDTDNAITSGSIGPLMDVGFGYGWRAARSIAHEALYGEPLRARTALEGDALHPKPSGEGR